MFNSGRPPGPVWNEKGKTQFGGVMTLLYVPLVAIYVYFLVVGIVTAPTQVSFEHVNPVSDRPGLSAAFTCTTPYNCRICALPCTSGAGMVDVAYLAESTIVFPFLAIENSHYIDWSLDTVKLGLAHSTRGTDGFTIGTVKGAGGTGSAVEVSVAAGDGDQTSSTKALSLPL